MKRLAFFDKYRKKRYFLSRIWSSKSICTWIMLNPSIADENIEDNTIKKCINFSKKWGHGGIQVVNLCSDISTDPSDIIEKIKLNHMPDKTSMNYIDNALNNCEIIYCAWGFGIKTPQWLNNRFSNKAVMALKLSKLNTPSHPLYINKNQVPVNFLD